MAVLINAFILPSKATRVGTARLSQAYFWRKMDYSKACRVCLMTEPAMMSIFKVNISKKMMSCAAVQVWENDGFPALICNKCSAKLHIAYQFKKQCEKTDAKLRQFLVQEKTSSSQEELFLDCGPMMDLNEAYSQPVLSQINYNIPPQIMGFNGVQLYGGGFVAASQPFVQVQDKSSVKKEKKFEEKQCPTCSKVFPTNTKLTRHLKTHSNEMPFKCKVCNKAFSHGGNYKIHLRMHTDERPFSCTVCNKGCRQAQDLEKHMRTHTGERPHKCTLCPRAFSTSSNLIAHVRTHTGERPYVCSVCQKAFCQSNELTKHMRTHTGEKSHVCDICNKGFNGSSTLIVHRRSHTGERPYSCTVCQKSFTQSSCLAVHMKRHVIES